MIQAPSRKLTFLFHLAIDDPNKPTKYFVEILGKQSHIAARTREQERWVYSPDVILDGNGKLLKGNMNNMFWYR